MIPPNWYSVDRVSSERYVKKSPVWNRSERFSRTALLVSLSVLVLLSSVALLPGRAVAVPASGTSVSTSNNSSNGGNPRPLITSSGPIDLVSPSSVSLLTVGSTFTVQVKVSNMSQFNGWDIQVQADPWVINATSLSISGNDFAINASSGSAFELVHCLNGRGTGCTATDRLGVVHSAYGNTAILGGGGASVGSYGLLFTITYKVTGNSAISPLYGYSLISIVNSLISDPNSGNGVPHTDTSGIYGTFVTIGGGGGGGHIPLRD